MVGLKFGWKALLRIFKNDRWEFLVEDVCKLEFLRYSSDDYANQEIMSKETPEKY
jgi:hypothetical protein